MPINIPGRRKSKDVVTDAKENTEAVMPGGTSDFTKDDANPGSAAQQASKEANEFKDTQGTSGLVAGDKQENTAVSGTDMLDKGNTIQESAVGTDTKQSDAFAPDAATKAAPNEGVEAGGVAPSSEAKTSPVENLTSGKEATEKAETATADESGTAGVAGATGGAVAGGTAASGTNVGSEGQEKAGQAASGVSREPSYKKTPPQTLAAINTDTTSPTQAHGQANGQTMNGDSVPASPAQDGGAAKPIDKHDLKNEVKNQKKYSKMLSREAAADSNRLTLAMKDTEKASKMETKAAKDPPKAQKAVDAAKKVEFKYKEKLVAAQQAYDKAVIDRESAEKELQSKIQRHKELSEDKEDKLKFLENLRRQKFTADEDRESKRSSAYATLNRAQGTLKGRPTV